MPRCWWLPRRMVHRWFRPMSQRRCRARCTPAQPATCRPRSSPAPLASRQRRTAVSCATFAIRPHCRWRSSRVPSARCQTRRRLRWRCWVPAARRPTACSDPLAEAATVPRLRTQVARARASWRAWSRPSVSGCVASSRRPSLRRRRCCFVYPFRLPGCCWSPDRLVPTRLIHSMRGSPPRRCSIARPSTATAATATNRPWAGARPTTRSAASAAGAVMRAKRRHQPRQHQRRRP